MDNLQLGNDSDNYSDEDFYSDEFEDNSDDNQQNK